MRSNFQRQFLLLAWVLLVFGGCSDNRFDRPRATATTNQIRLFALATQAALKDCGADRMATATYPDVFFQNPGWESWRGPYWQGRWQTNDYFDNPIEFVIVDHKLRITSPGRDQKLGTRDDIIEYVQLK